MSDIVISKFLSLVLRHKPEKIGITLDQNGWCLVSELIESCNIQGILLTSDILDSIVETNDKKRFIYNEDKTKIRAAQGHSIGVDLDLKSQVPPFTLYHGTVEKFIQSIKKEGLKKQNRNHVHLSTDKETAEKVGSRRGKPIILEISAKEMYNNGYKFYLSENNVWLTEEIPTRFINGI